MVYVVLITEAVLTILIVTMGILFISLPIAFIICKLEIYYDNWKEKRWQQKMKKERAEYRKQQEIKKRERELRKKEMSTHPLFYWKQTCKPTLRIKE